MRRVITIISVLIGLVVVISSSAHAQNTSWLTDNITFTKTGSDVDTPKLNPYGVPCGVIPSYKALSTDPWTGKTRTNYITNDCALSTDYGYISGDGTSPLLLAGTDTVYPLYNLNGSKKYGAIIPIPESDDVLFVGDGSYVNRYDDLPSNIEAIKDTSPLRLGRVKYYRATKPTDANKATFRDGSTDTHAVQGSLSFSTNGDYATFNDVKTFVRVRLSDMSAMRYGYITTSFGMTPSTTTAITDDGNIALTVDKSYMNWNIYNLENCTPKSPGADNCPSRNITSLITNNITGFTDVLSARFINDQIIDIVVKANHDGGSHIDEYKLTLPGASDKGFQYMALGDSFASGEGAYNYKLTTDTDQNHCHVSKSSYPYLIKASLSLDYAESIACSGAVMRDVNTVDLDDYNNENKGGPQAHGKEAAPYTTEISQSFLPGYRGQINFVTTYQPKTITLSIGGNNIGFGDIIKRCVIWPDTCYSTSQERIALSQIIEQQYQPLIDTYRQIIQTDPGVKLYIIGYPNIVDPDGNCALNVHLNHDEAELALKIEADLNSVIKRAADQAGAQYIDTSDAFAGHKMCETNSWDVAANGLTAGNDAGLPVIGGVGNESYHPNQLGHLLFSRTILQQTDGLTTDMPKSNDDTATTSQLNPDNDKLNTTHYLVNKIVDNPILKLGTPLGQSIELSKFFAQKGSQFVVSLHSTPIDIGTATATSTNELQLSATIPADIEPGPHEIHISGTDIDGNNVDMYEPITIYASDLDYDGDGVPNTQDQCNFVTPSNIDSDQDGIDDACDPLITEASVTKTPQTEQQTDGDTPINISNSPQIKLTNHITTTSATNEPKNSSYSPAPSSHQSILGEDVTVIPHKILAKIKTDTHNQNIVATMTIFIIIGAIVSLAGVTYLYRHQK